MEQSKITRLLILGIFIFIGIAILGNTTFLTIDAGHKGVLFKRFAGGLDKENTFSQGFHVVMPWNTMHIYDVRLNEAYEVMEVLSRNGLTIRVDMSYRFRPVQERIGHLHDNVGVDFHRRIIIPELRSATREVIGKYNPEELYSTQREAIQTEIYERTRDACARNDIIIDAVLIREVELPMSLQEAIERKLREEQAALEYEFRLERERQEAERRIIEANALAEANRLVSASLNDNILRNKGIDATIRLANSENTKVIVVGGGGDGLPLILGGN
ncbi:MAG: prohibitin family protein [Saprospirales bacterium]|nr:MAG: prohibitin family protein [Saprospirales bacterium]